MAIIFQNIQITGGLTIGAAFAAPGVLDVLSISAAAAYSTRRVRSSYTGPAMRVRRSIDNAEQDIGFDGAGLLDEAALIAHVGSGTGFVRTWYDQSGNDRDVSNAVSDAQARIVNGGVIERLGSRAAVRCLPLYSDRLATSGFASGSISYFTGSAVGRTVPQGPWQRFISINPVGGNDYSGGTGSGLIVTLDTDGVGSYRSFSPRSKSVVDTRNPMVMTSIYRPGEHVMFTNGVAATASSGSDAALGETIELRLGNVSDFSGALDGYLAEAIYIPLALTDVTRQALEQDQGTHFGISLS